MPFPLYVVDAFSDRPFRGNPAGVVIMDQWPSDDRMRDIAAEINHPESAFLRKTGEGAYDLRWFTPLVEMDLCGHATLASAAVIFRELGDKSEKLAFATRSGILTVRRGSDEGTYVLDFPQNPPHVCPPAPEVAAALGLRRVLRTYVARKKFLVLEVDQDTELPALRPNFSVLAGLSLPEEAHGVVVTRPGPKPYDFTSRMFAPWLGILEDPVTGSAHTVTGPLWASRLHQKELHAFQASPRGGALKLLVRSDGRIDLAGHAVVVLRGQLDIEG